MIPYMIALVRKNAQIPQIVIHIIPVFMVYDLAGFKGEMNRHDYTGNSLPLSVLGIIPLLSAFDKGIIALNRAEQALPGAYLAPWPDDLSPTSGAGQFNHTVIGWRYAVASQYLIDALPCNTVTTSDAYYWFKVGSKCIDNVNFLIGCQVCTHNTSVY